MNEKRHKNETLQCPVGSFFSDMEKVFGKKSDFAKHLNRSRIEFFKAFRSLLDEKIESLEEKGSVKSGRKKKNIKVE